MTNKTRRTFTLSPEACEALARVPNMSEHVESLVMEHYVGSTRDRLKMLERECARLSRSLRAADDKRRDLFAAAAIAALCPPMPDDNPIADDELVDASVDAWRVADMMIYHDPKAKR